jgi:hypothetical protein
VSVPVLTLLSCVISTTVLNLLLSADPYIPQNICDRLLATMCAREAHSEFTVNLCEVLLPLHSGATSIARRPPTKYTSSGGAGAGAACAPSPPVASINGTSSVLDAMPPLIAAFVPTPAHTVHNANLVNLLVLQQPAELLRHPLSLLLSIALRSSRKHTESSTAIVDTIIAAYTRMDTSAQNTKKLIAAGVSRRGRDDYEQSLTRTFSSSPRATSLTPGSSRTVNTKPSVASQRGILLCSCLPSSPVLAFTTATSTTANAAVPKAPATTTASAAAATR